MQHAGDGVVRNSLLRLLDPADFDRLMADLERVDLPRHMVLEEPGELIDHCYFFEDGLCSIIVGSDVARQAVAAHVGREGASGTSILLGATHAVGQAVIQISGWGWRLAAEDLRRLGGEIADLRQALLLFAQAMTIQVAHSLLAASRDRISQRLARWLLMCQDRTEGPELALTHELLAMMLAVRRSSVTDELHIFEGQKLIRANRGSIVVLDRPGLIDVAGGSYGIPEREYEQLFMHFGHHRSSTVDLPEAFEG